MLARRTILSLLQYLCLQNRPSLGILFDKHGLDASDLYGSPVVEDYLLEVALPPLISATPDKLTGLIEELIGTQADLLARVYKRERHDQRWDDFVRCLELNDYRIQDGRLIAVNPTIGDDPPLEDDLSVEVARSGLADAPQVLAAFENSAQAFRRTPPDYNAVLTHARVGVEMLAKAIALARNRTHPGSFSETSWGSVLTYLRTSGLITIEEEKGLVGVYGFLSPGAHQLIGFSAKEMARFGRNLAESMTYFLVKRYNG
jgi:hypothetical protein